MQLGVFCVGDLTKPYPDFEPDIYAIRGELKSTLRRIAKIKGLEFVGIYVSHSIDKINTLVTEFGTFNAH